MDYLIEAATSRLQVARAIRTAQSSRNCRGMQP